MILENVAEAGVVDYAFAGFAQLFSESRYVDIHRAVADESVVFPDPVDNLLARKMVALVLHKQKEYVVFFLCQRDRHSVDGNSLGNGVDGDGTTDKGGLVAGLHGRAFQDSLDACQHGGKREGLGDVVVAPRLEAIELVVLSTTGREEDHRCVVTPRTQPTNQFEARHLLHHNVKQDKVVDFSCPHHFEGRLGRVSPVGLEAFAFEVETEDFAQVGFVVDNKDA